VSWLSGPARRPLQRDHAIGRYGQAGARELEHFHRRREDLERLDLQQRHVAGIRGDGRGNHHYPAAASAGRGAPAPPGPVDPRDNLAPGPIVRYTIKVRSIDLGGFDYRDPFQNADGQWVVHPNEFIVFDSTQKNANGELCKWIARLAGSWRTSRVCSTVGRAASRFSSART
jgi:hypothetical protein